MPNLYGALDLQKNELRQAQIQNLGSSPANPVTGQLYYNTGDQTLYFCTVGGGSPTWVAAKAAAGTAAATSVTTQAIGDAGTVGVANAFAREDHKHGMPAFGNVTAQTAFGSASNNGAAVSLARSDHVHGTPTHDAAAHSAISLTSLAVPTADLSIGGFKLTNVATPLASTDGANKGYIDSAVAGLTWKTNVRVASTANRALTGLTAMDGITPIANDRILLKDQSAPAENGIWLAQSGAWTRALDADSGPELVNAAVFVSEGTAGADTAWTQTANLPITVGTTGLVWAQFVGAGSPPTGAAGGDLTGTYPNPTIGTGKVTSTHIADGTITDTDVNAANKDGVVGTASMRTLGTGAQQAAAGSHGHVLTGAEITGTLTTAKGGTNNAGPYVAGAVVYASGTTTLDDTAVGTAGQVLLSGGAGSPTWSNQSALVTGSVAHASTHQPGGADPMAVDAAAATGSLRTLGTGATQAASGTDSRLSDSRAPNGTATGDLTGTYPAPTIAALAVTDAKVAAANKDGLVAVPSMRTIGTGAQQAAAGSHGHVLTGAEITGTLPVSKGGTNNTATVAGGIAYGAGTTALTTAAAGTAGHLLTSGGAGAPTWTDPSTIVPAGVAKKYAGALTGTTSPETVTHNLNTRDIQLTVLNGSTPYTAVEVDWDATTVNTAVIRFSPNLGAGYRVVVVG